MPSNVLRRISQRINSSLGSSNTPVNDSITYHDADEESRHSRATTSEFSRDKVPLLSTSGIRTTEINTPHHPIPIRQRPHTSHSQQREHPTGIMSGYTTADDEPPADEHSPLRRFNPHRPMHPSFDSGVGMSEGSPSSKLSRTEIDTFSRITVGETIHPNMINSFTPTTGLRPAHSTHSYFPTFNTETLEANATNPRHQLRRRSSSIHRLQSRSSDSLHRMGNAIDTDDLFRAIEGANNRTVGLILEGHLEKILRTTLNPLVENVEARRTVCVARDSIELARVRSREAVVEGVVERRKGVRGLVRWVKERFSGTCKERGGRKREKF